jgi:phospholipid transport system substrate-binding protein
MACCAVARRCTWLLFASLLALSAVPAVAQTESSDPAVARIRMFYDVLVTVMKEAEKLGVRGRYDRLTPAIRSTFDLSAMTRIAVGPDWNSIPAEQQDALIEAFTRMTIATYASRFDGFSGERFEVDPASETRSTGRLVKSRLIQSSGAPVTLNYLMRGSDDSWKAVDVYLSGTISELATRRSEFGAIFKSGGAAALIESLRQQGDKLMRQGAKS